MSKPVDIYSQLRIPKPFDALHRLLIINIAGIEAMLVHVLKEQHAPSK